MHSKFTLAFACACTLGVALAGAATIRADSTPEPPPETTTSEPQWTQRDIQREIDRYRHETWRWQRTMGRSLTRQLKDPPSSVQARIAVWHRVALNTRRRAQNPPHKRQWLCIHDFEGG